MARSDLLRRLFTSYGRGDDSTFLAVAREIVEDERQKNHQLLAAELERALHRDDQRPGVDVPLTMRPVPKGRDDRPLLMLTKPKHELDELILPNGTRELLDEIVRENLQRSTLLSHGLAPRQSFLLVGPPGTGKSAAAHGVAAELRLPVATVSLAALTSSFLGDTARNIEAVVRFAEHTPCVLLFDEFDVLGQERSERGDHGEMRRVAATVLQLLEEASGESVIAATSNHPNLVDSAAWRRFDEVVCFDLLGPAELAELISLKLRAVRSSINPESWAHRVAGFPPAEVEIACFDAMRRAVLVDRHAVDDDLMTAAVRRLTERRMWMSRSGASPDE